MTDNTLSIEIEELVIALQTLTTHEQQLLEDNKAQSKSNDELAEQIVGILKQLTDLLKIYQTKEQLIIDNTSQALENTINVAFEKNQESYHGLINKGFTTHIDTATEKLSEVATNVKKQFEDLEVVAHNSKTEFERRQTFFKLYEDTYDIQSRKIKESVDETMTQVLSDTKDKLDDVGSDFSYKLAKDLSWKVTTVFGTVCVLIMLLTFGSAWLFIPSKADISQRQSQYRALEKAQLFNKVVQVDDSYYAEIDKTKCRNDFKSKFWSNPTWCKFK